MRFVKNQRVVLFQPVVVLHLRQQDAVGHQFDPRVSAGRVGEPRLVSDSRPPFASPFLGQPRGDRPSRDAARLRVANQSLDTPPQFEADARHLRRLSRARFAANDNHRMSLDRRRDPLAMLGDRQRRIAAHRRRLGRSGRLTRGRTCPIGKPAVPSGFDGRPATRGATQIPQPTTQPPPIPEQGLGESRFPVRIVKLHRFNRQC